MPFGLAAGSVVGVITGVKNGLSAQTSLKLAADRGQHAAQEFVSNHKHNESSKTLTEKQTKQEQDIAKNRTEIEKLKSSFEEREKTKKNNPQMMVS